MINEVCSNLANEPEYLLSFPKGKELLVLTFNYTNIFEILYQHDFNNVDSNFPIIKTFYIHGEVNNNDKCNLVLGTHSFSNTTIPVDFNVFKKHNQRHKFGTIEAYQNFIEKLSKIGIATFHVIGHSLDKTDHNILKHVFLANKNAVINIYYHDEEAQERLINNITDIIGVKIIIPLPLILLFFFNINPLHLTSHYVSKKFYPLITLKFFSLIS